MSTPAPADKWLTAFDMVKDLQERFKHIEGLVNGIVYFHEQLLNENRGPQ